MKKTEQEFEKNSLLLFVLMMSANVCNYLFQIVMGNLMEVEQYAQANTVVSLVGVLSIPTTIITMISARYIALNASNGRYDRIRDVIHLMLKFASCIGLVLAIVILILLNKITILFALDSKYYVIGALVITIVNLCYSITSGTLQGMKHFFQYGMQSIMIAAGKLIFSIGLVLLGWKVYGIITALLLGTGIRVSECVGLDLQDIDFKNNGITVTRKGGNQMVVYFGEEVENALKTYLYTTRKQAIPLSGHENALFLSTQRKRMGVQAVENMVKKYAREVTPNKKITPHKLRSTYGTALYKETGDIYLVADVLGHKDVNTTKKHYAAIDEERRRQAAGAVKLREV